LIRAFWHDYEFTRVNWIDFTFIGLSVERDFMTGSFEINAALLGLHMRLAWVVNREESEDFLAEMRQRMSEAGIPVPDDLVAPEQ